MRGPERKKILIMTASIGSGHVKAAEAIRDELRARFPEYEVRMLDFMDRRVSAINSLLKRLYLTMLDFVPNLYDVFYHIAGGASGGTAARQVFALLMYRTMARLIRRHAPDVLVCTHPFPEGAAALWKRIHRGDLRLVVVLTDYSLHPIWIYRQVDCFFTATEEMRQGLLQQGFPEDAVHACGIPLGPSIERAPGREEARSSLGISKEARVVLIMGGGLGLGGIEATLDELEKLELPLEFLVVAGRNRKLKSRLVARSETSRHGIRVWGYTGDVYVLMRAADLLVTKPGALTMSEALALGLPMLLHEPIPGPETENAIYAESHGAALWVRHGSSIAQILGRIFCEGDCLERMRARSRACGHPEAARNIVERIVTQ